MLLGGKGATRTPRLAARYADEFNVPFEPLEVNRDRFTRVRQACAELGRDPDEIVYSSTLVVCVGKDDAEVARRAANIGRQVEELKQNGLAGSPAEVVDKIGRYAEAGAERIYLQVLDLDDLDHLELIASQVLSQVG
ncbi:LLM class flavin-dependent oxidoreductase [Carbonactinospora thermoautotrophica]|uniref:LLM class flavin-dependent oxidoreductase n=1 Tax=Carbonactinospora thermoautotrophica TaxID=1469144 RepID=UPI003DA96561